MKVRELLKKDLDTLTDLHKQFWGEDSDIDMVRSKFDKLAGDNRYLFLCAEMDNRIVGSVMGIVCEELYGNCKPFLVMENLVIDKNYRKKGIGKVLLAELEKRAKEQECSQILSITETTRNDAILFYESLGFNSKSHIGFKKSLAGN